MRFDRLKRRDFITLLGGAAGCSLAVGAQQPAMPVIGFLLSGSPGGDTSYLTALFRRHLAEAGYVEGHNVTIDYRYAQLQYDRLPELAADLVRRQVAVIVCGPTNSPAVAAKAATATIPIVFSVSDDPVKLGLVASLARPGGNATGINFFVTELGAKQLGLLRELVPAAVRIGLLLNPSVISPTAETVKRDVMAAAPALGVQIDVLEARDSHEIETAFTRLARDKVGALLVGPDLLFYNRRIQLATLATRHALPAIYTLREFAEAGGLMSYGTNWSEQYRQVALYTARILKGTRPADLPVVQSTKFEFVINLPTASALGLDVPPALLARADKVIE
jgi:putative ABC transport system substrate-binding protein